MHASKALYYIDYRCFKNLNLEMVGNQLPHDICCKLEHCSVLRHSFPSCSICTDTLNKPILTVLFKTTGWPKKQGFAFLSQ